MRVVRLPSSFAACLLVTWRKPLHRDLSGVLFAGGSGLVAELLVGPAPRHDVADCAIRVEKQEQQAREVRDCIALLPN